MATVATPPHKSSGPEVVELVQAKSDEFNWVFFTVIAAFHVGAVAALFTFRWSSLAVFFVMWIFGQNVGIAISYHRQLTHRGFTTPKWLEHAMAICGTMALQGSPTYWVAVHRLHHQYTDKPGDPTLPATGSGGRIWGGFCMGLCIARRRCCRGMPRTCRTIRSTGGWRCGTGFRSR